MSSVSRVGSDTSCIPGDADVLGQVPQKQIGTHASEMGGRNSVPGESVEGTVETSIASRNCQHVGINNNVKDSCYNEDCQKDEDGHTKRNVYDKPVGREAVLKASTRDKVENPVENQDMETTLVKKENSFVNEKTISEDANNLKVLENNLHQQERYLNDERVEKPKDNCTLSNSNKLKSESCEATQEDKLDERNDSCSSAIVSQNTCNQVKNKPNVDNKPKYNCALSNSNKLESRSCEATQEDKLNEERDDSCSSTIVSRNTCNQVKNKPNVDNGKFEQENYEQNSISVCKEIVDSVSNICNQDSDGISLPVENTNRKDGIIDDESFPKKTRKRTLSVCSEKQKSCEQVKNVNSNLANLRTPQSDNEIAHKVQMEQNTTLEGESAINDNTMTVNLSDINNINQSMDNRVQQVEHKPKQNVFLKNEDKETNKNSKVVSISAVEQSCTFQKNHDKLEINEPHEIDNTCDREQIEIVCENEQLLQDVTLKTSANECAKGTDKRCEDYLNKETSKLLLVQSEFNQETNTNSSDLSTKEPSGSFLIKKPPLFQRGSFPRICLKDYGMITIKKLRKELQQEREKREKREQRERDEALRISTVAKTKQNVKNRKVAKKVSTDATTICVSSDDKLKCAQVCLIRMNASILSKYNVHLPSPHADSSSGSGPSGVNIDSNSTSISVTSAPENISDNLTENDSSSDSGPSGVKINSNSTRISETAGPENILNNLTENDNSLDCCMETSRGFKRSSTQIHAHSKKQKQSEVKIARVHISRIENSVLSKYGYNSKCLEIGKATEMPCPTSAHSSSVISSADKDNSGKAIVNNALEGEILLNQPTCAPTKINHSFPISMEDDEELVTMTNSDKGEINDSIKKSSSDSCKNTTAPLILNDEVLICSRTIFKKKSLNKDKSMGKTKCSLKKNNLNLKTPQVVVRKIPESTLSSLALSKKVSNQSSAKTELKTKSSIERTVIDGKVPQVIIHKIENASLSSPILLNRSQSTSKPISKMKNSINSNVNLKTAQVILKNMKSSSISSDIVSKNLSKRTLRNVRISKKKSNNQSSEVLQEKSSPKIQIISQSKCSDDIENQNEIVNKACTYKTDVRDHSKENVCLNSDLKCARVCLPRLERLFM